MDFTQEYATAPLESAGLAGPGSSPNSRDNGELPPPPTPPRFQKASGKSASVRTPKSAAFKEKLRIDVNTPDNIGPQVLSSPLGMFATRKLPSNTHREHPVAMFTGAETSNSHSNATQRYGSPFLEYGMIISLMCDDRNGVMAAEGFASRDVRLEKLQYHQQHRNSGITENDPSTLDVSRMLPKLGLGGVEERKLLTDSETRLLPCPFRDCLFEVVPKMTYDATLALEALIFTEHTNERIMANTYEQQVPSIADLKFKSSAEKRLNASVYKKFQGQQVIYGQIIQLRHVKSGKFLTLNTSPVPIRGAEHVPVSLEVGSPCAHFSLLPRYKLRSKGSPVQLTDQLVLTSGNDIQPCSLFVSNRNSSDGTSCTVVGSSAHSSQWRVVHYDQIRDYNLDAGNENRLDRSHSDGLRAGSCVRLYHLESSSWLQSHISPNDSSSGQVSLHYKDENDSEDGRERCYSLNSLWELEHAIVYEGGEIMWNDAITLRHVLTGNYLSVAPYRAAPPYPGRSPVAVRAMSSACGYVAAQENPQSFCFMSTAVTGKEDQIENGDIILIQHQKTQGFVHSIETHASTTADIRFASKSLSTDSTGSGSSFAVVTLLGARDEDAFKIAAASSSEVEDTLILISYKRVLLQFKQQFRQPGLMRSTSCDDNQFDREEIIECFESVERAIIELSNFCVGDASLKQKRVRQDLFRAHGYIDILLDMVKAPFQCFGGPFTVEQVSMYNGDMIKMSNVENGRQKGTTIDECSAGSFLYSPILPEKSLMAENSESGGSSPSKLKSLHSRGQSSSATRTAYRRRSGSASALNLRQELHSLAMQILNRIIPAINVLLVQIFSENRTNELYMVRTAMPVLIDLLGNGFQTSFPLSYLLQENRNLVESITAYVSIIRSFFELIKSRGKSIRFMQYLAAMCTSKGHGVPKTQETICEFLFNPDYGYRDHAIVPIRPAESGFEIYVSDLSLTVKDTDPRIESMFNKNAKKATLDDGSGRWMPLAIFYKDYCMKGLHSVLGQYCYGLFRLYVSLCLDRNYVSIDYIQTAFPRMNLLTSIVDHSLSPSLRAVLMDLIRVAYIDCEPQKVLSCPNYTRVWTEIGSNEATLLGYSSPAYSNCDLDFFSRMKEFCSSYLQDIRGVIAIEEIHKNELTLAIVRASKNMVQFGMYATIGELSQLVTQLFNLLDERTDLICQLDSSKASGDDVIDNISSSGLVAGTATPFTARPREVAGLDGERNFFTKMLAPLPPQHPVLPILSSDGGKRMTKSGSMAMIIEASPPFRYAELHDKLISPGLVAQKSLSRDSSWKSSAKLTAFSTEKVGSTRQCYHAFERGGDFDGTLWSGNVPLEGNRELTFQQTLGIDPMMLSTRITPTREGSHVIDKAIVQNKEFTRHQMNDLSRVVMEIKDEVCAILQHVDNIRLDFQISKLMLSFKTHHGGVFSDSLQEKGTAQGDGKGKIGGAVAKDNVSAFQPSTHDVPPAYNFTDKCSPLAKYAFGTSSLECTLSLSRLAKRNVTTIFMQLLMYEYPQLVSKALELLLQQFNQHDQLLKAMQNVQLLVAEETIKIYVKMKDDVDALRRLSEATEVWMDLTSKSDFEKAESTCMLLKSLVDVIETNKSASSSKTSFSASELRDHNLVAESVPSHDNAQDDERNEASEQRAVSFGIQERTYAPRFTVEKKPPNRKVKHLRDRYILSALLGHVSRLSSCHELFPFENSPSRTSRAGIDSTLDMEARRLLRNLGAAKYVLNMLADGAHFFDEHFAQNNAIQGSPQSPASPTSRMRAMLNARQLDQIQAVFYNGMKFLCRFCSNDPENQASLAPHASMIAGYIGQLEVAQELLVSIYAGNRLLMKAIPTELVNIFVTRLIEDGPEPRYLFFLETIVMCDEYPILENQLLVLFQLIKSLEVSSVLQFFDDSTATVDMFDELLSRHALIMCGVVDNTTHYEGDVPFTQDVVNDGSTKTRNDTSDTAKSRHADLIVGSKQSSHINISIPSLPTPSCNEINFAKDSKTLEYHVRLLHLFAACAAGKNTRVQEICQQIVPLTVVLELMCHTDCTVGLQVALLRYLDQVFLIADDIEAPSNDVLAQILNGLSHVCEMSVRNYVKDVQREDINCRAQQSLQKYKSKLGNLNNFPRAKGPMESPALYCILHAVFPTLLSFIHQFPDVFDTSDDAHQSITRAYQSITLLITICAARDWEMKDYVLENMTELVFSLDKIIRIDFTESLKILVSLESIWSASLQVYQRLDFSFLNLDRDLPELLESALDERAKNAPHSPVAVGPARANRNDPNKKPSMHNDSMEYSSEPNTDSGISTDSAVCSSTSMINGNNLLNEDSANINPRDTQLRKLRETQIMVRDSQTDGDNKAIWRGSMNKHLHRGNSARIPSHSTSTGKESLVSIPRTRSGSYQPVVQRLSPPKSYGRFRHRYKPTIQDELLDKQLLSPVASVQSSSVRPATLAGPRSSNVNQTQNLSEMQGSMAGPTGSRPVRRQQQFCDFEQFLSWLRDHPRVHTAIRDELNQMVDSILRVEATLTDEFNPQLHLSNIRFTFDQVVSKLIAHVEMFRDSKYVKMNLTLLDVLSRMIYAVDDLDRRHVMQKKLNQLGVTRLVVQLISSRDDDALFASSIELGVALLDGMNAEVQESFYTYYSDPSNKGFFEKIQGQIEKASKLIRSNDRIILPGGDFANNASSTISRNVNIHALAGADLKQPQRMQKRASTLGIERDTRPPPQRDPVIKDGLKGEGAATISIFRFLQLLCEGHFLNAQRCLIFQPFAKVANNLVESTTSFLLETYLVIADVDVKLIIQLFETITEFCQGPCNEAQEAVASNKFLSVVNALMVHSVNENSALKKTQMHQLRASIVITLLSLLEGRSDRAIHSQLIQELHFDALKENLIDVYTYFLREHGYYAGNSKCSNDFYLTMGFNVYILLQQLADVHPLAASWIPSVKLDHHVEATYQTKNWSPSESLRRIALTNGLVAEYDEAYYFFHANCARVEILWDRNRSVSNKLKVTSVPNSVEGNIGVTPPQGDRDALALNAGATQNQEQSSGTLIPIYFPLHPICFCLTEQSKKKLVWHVSRGANKLHDFYSRSDKLVDEMAHQSRLRRHVYISGIAKQSDRLKRISFALAVGINLSVLLFYRADGIHSMPYAANKVAIIVSTNRTDIHRSEGIDTALLVAGTIQMNLCCLILICYLINSAPLLIKKGWKRRNQSEQEKLSKQTASVHRRSNDVDEKESFQDTELLLRALREREEEYDYLFLPRFSTKPKLPMSWRLSRRKSASVSNVTPNRERTPNSNSMGMGTRQQIQITAISLFFLIRNPRVIYFLWQIFIAILGSYVNKLYFAFHLLDVVNRYQDLSNVLRSVVRPAKVLGLTVLLYLVIVYVFAIIGFFFFREDYNPSGLTEDQRAGRESYQCQRLFECFLINLDQGFKYNGGIGGYMRQHALGASAYSYGRLAFDLLYNTILMIMLLNIVFGVIIDTFASLRTADNEKLLDMQNRCFICSIDAYTFDRLTKRGFHDHIYMEHNMWHYLYLFVHIRKKPITEYNGMELYLAMRMAKKDVSFFPSHRALSLEKNQGEGDDVEVVDRFMAELPPHESSNPGNGHDGNIHSGGGPRLRSSSLIHGQGARVHRSTVEQANSVPQSRGSLHRLGASGRNLRGSSTVDSDSTDRITNAKLDKLEASLENILSSHQEMKEQQRKLSKMQTQILELVADLRQQQARCFLSSAEKTLIGHSSAPSKGGDQPPSLHNNPIATLQTAASSSPSSPTQLSLRRHSLQKPRVFDFESVDEDDN